jgi:type II restriction enzyme
MPPGILKVLDGFNRESNGAVETYIYARFAERQGLVKDVISGLRTAVPSSFKIASILSKFESTPGLRRSVDKAYEIVAFALLDLVVEAMDVQVAVEVPLKGRALLSEFDDLAKKLIGISSSEYSHRTRARIYRVGVTNAADRGLDMWANFGPAIQVKHLPLSRDLADEIVGQLDADRIVVVCRDAPAKVLRDVLHESSVGKRISGIVQQSDLVHWYDRIMKGSRAHDLGQKLIDKLIDCFEAEFPQATDVTEAFMRERGYRPAALPSGWSL